MDASQGSTSGSIAKQKFDVALRKLRRAAMEFHFGDADVDVLADAAEAYGKADEDLCLAQQDAEASSASPKADLATPAERLAQVLVGRTGTIDVGPDGEVRTFSVFNDAGEEVDLLRLGVTATVS